MNWRDALVCQGMMKNLREQNNTMYFDPQVSAKCESAIEEKFSYHINKYLASPLKLIPQFPASTAWGNFRLDFTYTFDNGYKVAFECDGKDFHDGWRDEWRDALILGSGLVNRIFRIPGSAIYHHIEDTLFIISKIEPKLFSTRGLTNLKALASNHVESFTPNPSRMYIHMSYPSSDIRLEYRPKSTENNEK